MARPKEKEEIILQAALEAFMDKGFPNTSMKEICQIAGIGKGTIYDYFASKDDLFIEASIYKKQVFIDLFSERVFSQGNFSNTIRNAIDHIVSSDTRQHVQWMDMVLTAIPALKPESKIRLLELKGNFRQDGIETWKKILSIGLEEGKISIIDLDFTAACIFCLTLEYKGYLSDLTDIQYDKEKERLTEFIFNGIGYKDSDIEQ